MGNPRALVSTPAATSPTGSTCSSARKSPRRVPARPRLRLGTTALLPLPPQRQPLSCRPRTAGRAEGAHALLHGPATPGLHALAGFQVKRGGGDSSHHSRAPRLQGHGPTEHWWQSQPTGEETQAPQAKGPHQATPGGAGPCGPRSAPRPAAPTGPGGGKFQLGQGSDGVLRSASETDPLLRGPPAASPVTAAPQPAAAGRPRSRRLLPGTCGPSVHAASGRPSVV